MIKLSHRCFFAGLDRSFAFNSENVTAHFFRGMIFSAALFSATTAMSEGAIGIVREVRDGIATVESGGANSTVGDGVQFFFKIEGLDEEIAVATGKVIAQDGGTLQVRIEEATGEVAKDHLVRFVPGKSGTGASATTPAPQVLSTPGPPSAQTTRPPAIAGYMGMQLATPSGGAAGALVLEAVAGGPAAAAGVLHGDLIVALDGVPIANPQQLSAAIAKLSPGSSHTLSISRQEKSLRLDVLVQLRPAEPSFISSESNALPSPTQTLPPSIPFPSATPNAQASAASSSDLDPVAAEHFNQGVAQYLAGNIDGAIASYTSALRSAPSFAAAYLNRANAYLYKPDFKAAIADANKALELKIAQTDDAYVIRGTAKAGLGDYYSGIADCNRALKVNPKHALAYNNRANNKLRKLDDRGALNDCNKSIALNPVSALPYYNRGFAQVNLGNHATALADWRKAVALQSSFGAELNPKIAQLEAAGIKAKLSTTSASASEPQWTDLTNAPKKILGTWQGGRHRTQYFADGTFVTDPHLVPDPPRTRWQIQGDRLVEYFNGKPVTHQILSLDQQALVIKNAQGKTFRLTRLAP